MCTYTSYGPSSDTAARVLDCNRSWVLALTLPSCLLRTAAPSPYRVCTREKPNSRALQGLGVLGLQLKACNSKFVIQHMPPQFGSVHPIPSVKFMNLGLLPLPFSLEATPLPPLARLAPKVGQQSPDADRSAAPASVSIPAGPRSDTAVRLDSGSAAVPTTRGVPPGTFCVAAYSWPLAVGPSAPSASAPPGGTDDRKASNSGESAGRPLSAAPPTRLHTSRRRQEDDGVKNAS